MSKEINLDELSPEQLQALQKQMKARKQEVNSKRGERFGIIDGMLVERDAENNFIHTTRDILNKLAENGLVDQTPEKWDQNEIKKIQARKQFLEKSTGKDGKLVHPEGTFGYKQSAGMGFVITPTRVETFFDDKDKVKQLTADQRRKILKALKGA